MKFTHYDLKRRARGDTVVVTLSGNAANVRLMDHANFRKYRARKTHQFTGGHVTQSPVRFRIPHAGHWHIAVDLGGYPGAVRSSIEILPGPLPSISEAPLASVPSLIQVNQGMSEEEYAREFDVFISHASEDKDAVVRPLAQTLRDGGLRVWYDEFELRIGDSLRRKIDKGLVSSRFGIVVLSQAFFGKGWTNYELDGLVTRSTTGEQIILPVWHNISKQEVVAFSPTLADKVARNTATHTVEDIAAEIVEVVTQPYSVEQPFES